ncbi:pseudouridine-5'-phosphatase isoform X2 [Rhipicephalus microplus]|uniref:pseudouridine-5'-phosphatase isoform X2 n=1 Tax=Rhipicephalus microplus TaxID=6941 RepID=UPI003F6D0F11
MTAKRGAEAPEKLQGFNENYGLFYRWSAHSTRRPERSLRKLSQQSAWWLDTLTWSAVQHDTTMTEVNGPLVNMFNAGTGLLRLGSTAGAKTRSTTASRFKPVTHVIFDMDGLLLAETVASRYGKMFTWELKKRVMGTPEADAARTTIDFLGLPLTTHEYMAALDHIFEETFPEAQLMPGADKLVRHLCAHDIPIAIATSSKPASFTLKMSRHREFLALFHHVVCSGGDPDVRRGKPHPDIFLVTASRFDEMPPPQKVLVFEDSVMGVKAAIAAGMQVVMVPDPRIDEEKRRLATTSLSSLLDFEPELFDLPGFEIPAQDQKKRNHSYFLSATRAPSQ